MQAFELRVNYDDRTKVYPLVAKDPISLAIAMSPILDKLGDENLFRVEVKELGKAKPYHYKRRVTEIVKQR